MEATICEVIKLHNALFTQFCLGYGQTLHFIFSKPVAATCTRTIRSELNIAPMSYILDISIEGHGKDPSRRSHWGFMIHKEGDTIGELLNVKVLDVGTLRYQFEERDADLVNLASEGRWKVAMLTYEQRIAVKDIIRRVPAPADGKKRCQDWVLDACINLEVEELIPAGFSNRVGECIGLPADDLAAQVGDGWTRASLVPVSGEPHA